MADNTMITAGIGGGKSLLATIWICTELEKSERFICSSVALKEPEIAEYCHKYIDRPIDLKKRLRVLNHDQAREWWLYLPGHDFKDISEVASRQGHDYGCLYVLDEVHLLYPARQWQKTGDKVETYMSQLRKLNDDLVTITQHREKVDKNFRRNVTRHVVVTNLGKKNLFLGVGLPDRFRWNEYSQEPVRGDKPDASGWYSLRGRPYGNLYDTMAGVGFAGGIAPEQKPKRAHWWRWIAFVVVLTALGVVIPKLAGKGIGAAIGLGVDSGVKSMSKAAGLGSVPVTSNLPPVTSAPPVAVAPGGLISGYTVVTTNVPIECEGYLIANGRMKVFLTDGSSAYAERIRPDSAVWVNGREYRFAKTKTSPAPVGFQTIPVIPNESNYTRKTNIVIVPQ